MKYLKYFSGISLLLLLTACNTRKLQHQIIRELEKYTGKSKIGKYPGISKNGENYFITNTIKDKSGKTDKKNPMPASVADNGLLQINSGTGVVDFAIDEKLAIWSVQAPSIKSQIML